MRRSLAALSTLALLSTVLLTACGTDDLVEGVAERAVENAAEQDGVDVDIDSEDGSVKVETDQGTFSSGGDLPDDFPDDVPLLDGEVLQAASADNGGAPSYVVTLRVDASAEAALEEAGALLEGAGLTESEESASLADTGYRAYEGAWDVILGATDTGSGSTMVQYAVTTPSS